MFEIMKEPGAHRAEIGKEETMKHRTAGDLLNRTEGQNNG